MNYDRRRRNQRPIRLLRDNFVTFRVLTLAKSGNSGAHSAHFVTFLGDVVFSEASLSGAAYRLPPP